MEIVDTHCHATPYWYEPVESLLGQMNRNQVAKAVLIQVAGIFDNSYVIECMRRFPGRFAAVAMIDTDRPDAPETLADWVDRGITGLRLNPDTRSPGSDPLAIWRKAAELNIPISCQGSNVDAFSSEDFEGVIKELPDLKIIIEHLGGGGQDTTPPHTRYQKVLALAQHPNTYMKIPGFGEICPRPLTFPASSPESSPASSNESFPFENVPPLIEMAIEAFGPKRLMWGSNFPPVAGRGEGFRNSLRWPLERLPFKSEADKEWIFGKTALSLWNFP